MEYLINLRPTDSWYSFHKYDVVARCSLLVGENDPKSMKLYPPRNSSRKYDVNRKKHILHSFITKKFTKYCSYNITLRLSVAIFQKFTQFTLLQQRSY